jgi:lipopolysaccharide transport system ATP-binding protein
MSSDDIAIRVSDLSKCYQIYSNPRDRLKQFVVPRIQRLSGRPPTQYFRDFWALKDVSFEVKRGETVGIIGRNGAGKSTVLQIICGTLSPTTGTVETRGRIAALLELGSGFNPEFTGRENVYLNAALLGLSTEETSSRFDEIIAFSGIEGFIDQPVKTYSSGMYVRLAFAIIANVDADILVIDEALAVGDVFFSQKCMRFLHNFKTRGTIIFVTHNTAAVVGMCERAVWMDGGKAISIGPAKRVCEEYLAKHYDSSPVTSSKSNARTPLAGPDRNKLSKHDARMSFINHSNLRNDIEVFDFSPNTRGFGNGGAAITNAMLTDLDGRQLSWVVGGEMVRVVVEAEVKATCSSVIVGFQLKNRLGQVLFAQNSYVAYHQNPLAAAAGDIVHCAFTFRMPILPSGQYVVDVAIADGTPPDNVTQLQWLHDSFSLESHTSSTVSGLIGLAFESIELYKQDSVSLQQ